MGPGYRIRPHSQYPRYGLSAGAAAFAKTMRSALGNWQGAPGQKAQKFASAPLDRNKARHHGWGLFAA